MNKACDKEAVVIGAGIAGLACARALVAAGMDVVILEKSRGVGGRCATRRIDGRPVDHGIPFYHGQDGGFRQALEQADPQGLLVDWPREVAGKGTPCQPQSLSPEHFRVAFREGMTTFPKFLGRDLDVRHETKATRLAWGAHVEIETAEGMTFRSPRLVLALPIPQARQLLETIEPPSQHLKSFLRVLQMTATQSTLTLLAGYAGDAPVPDWDLYYPDRSDVVDFISHDSNKRPGGGEAPQVLVFHTRASWSRSRFTETPESWSGAVLDEARRLLGPWANRPRWTQTHRWRYARANGTPPLKEPLYVLGTELPSLGIAGEFFAPGGGVEAAWRSGNKLAALILGDR